MFEDLKHYYDLYIKRYNIENIYIGHPLYIHSLRKLDDNKIKYEYITFGITLFYLNEDKTCVSLYDNKIYPAYKKKGFCADINYERKNAKEFCIENDIPYKKYMSKYELFNYVYKDTFKENNFVSVIINERSRKRKR